ncbi:MAG: cryptochrome/photolyase family protein [Armatimonadetes bacterium]|nr:cryptochrome/photolyase family protein [Armatimonadota bacterium]
MDTRTRATRNLVLVLGDQLDARSSAFDGFDPSYDRVWMVEVTEEAEYVWSHKARIALFLSAMRHFRDRLRQAGWTVEYRQLDDAGARGNFRDELTVSVRKLRPERLVVVEPGEWRVREALQSTAARLAIPLEIRPDRHFLCSLEDFEQHAASRRQLRMEFFYRQMRQRLGVLMAGNGPAGGRWNFDAENRQGFGREGPSTVPPPLRFTPDATTREVIALVEKRFAGHPGSLAHFDWPVTPEDAEAALKDFVSNRLASFGPYQDAMWTGQPWLYHSRLSAPLNLKLLDPRQTIALAGEAWRSGDAPLPSVEGFIRQILGWREYVRGVYWRFMPGYAQRNALGAQGPLPRLYWTADTDLNCLHEVVRQTLEYGYAHHIQRLMVTGLLAQLLGVAPSEVHRWYLAVYVDAVEWVELPNTLGMSQFADGGLMASKPYVATGKYLQRMSNYCAGCRYDPAVTVGGRACPFSTLYWDFLARHEGTLRNNPRMVLQVRNLRRLSQDDREQIASQAARVRDTLCR